MKGLKLVDPIPNSLNYIQHHKNCMADSKEDYMYR